MSDFSTHQSEPTSLENTPDNFEELWETNGFPNKATLPFNFESLHPDDAKDKVFAAILKALVELGNKPSSPKELANCIMKHKFTLLGGATPYATVSSRISQHFKRAVEHKPPRTPLLARSVDEKHSRKIQYYIANDDVRIDDNHFPPIPSPHQTLKPPKGTINVDRGYPKLKILLKKRKSSIKGTHVFKRYKTMLSGPRPGVGRGKGKGKWAPHTEHRSCNRIYNTDSSGSGSEADIDEFGPESEHEFTSDTVGSFPTIERNNISSHGECSSSHDSILDITSLEASESSKPPTNLPVDAEYSDYFEEMMNGDLCIENYDAGSLLTNQEPSVTSSPPCQRASSDSINSPTYEHPTSASSTVTPEPTIRKRNVMDTVLLTPDTSSLFEREFDSHLIPSFDDEFNGNSSLASKHSPYIPLMELNNPEMMPVSELDELLNGSPRTHKRPFGVHRNTRSFRTQVIHDISLNSRSATQRTSFPKFNHHEDLDHMVPSREDEIVEADMGTFHTKVDISPMEVDTRYERMSETRPGIVSVQDHKEKTVEDITMEGIEQFSESSIGTNDKTPMVATKVYSNIKVYETVLPDTQFRLMRFHSNVSLHGDSSPENENENKKRGRSMIMLEENRHMDFCNASLLRKAAQSYVNHGKSESNDEYTRFVVIRNGPVECRGVWVSLDRARHLVEEYGIQDVPQIQQLLSNEPLASVYDPVEMDKHLVELSGILGSAVAEYNLSRKNSEEVSFPADLGDTSMILDTQCKETELVDPSIENNVDDLDPDTYISLDQDDEESTPDQGSSEADSTHLAARSPNEGDDPIDASLVGEKKAFIPTQTPTTPAIYLTVIESVPVYVTYLSGGPDNHETIQLMRRFDTGYVNGTKLLMVGGVETESERTIVLSLEVGRIRVRKEDSKLFGTWIPLPRARALASTCSLQHKLGPFLEDKLSTYFPNPLPNSITVPKPMRLTSRLHQVLKAKASTLSTRNTIGSSIGISPQSLHPSKNFFSGPNYHIYQILGLQGSKQSKSAALSGIFGGPGVVGTHDDKNGKKWSKKVKSRFVNGKRSLKGYREEAGVDKMKNSRLTTPTSTHMSVVVKNETESDLEIEEVRRTIQIQRLSDPEISRSSHDHDSSNEKLRDGDFSEVDIGGSDHDDDLR